MLVDRVEVEDLVLDRDDVAAARDEVPTAQDAVGLRARRAVERLRGGRAPVGEEGVVRLVAQTDATDVTVAAVGEIEPTEDLRCRSGSEHPSLFEHDHRVGEPRHFVDLVADIDDRDGRLVADRLDIGQDLEPPSPIERRERLVHQKYPGFDDQGAR